MQGPKGLVHSARPGQIVIELGSHPVPDKKRQIAPLQQKGAEFIDGEVSGTPGMVSARKGVIYLAGDAAACKQAERVVAGFADSCLYFGEFGAASRVKLVNNLLVAVNIAATAEAMALGLKAGVDLPLMIKAIATGSGGSTQFGIRAPWMAERRFQPVQGPVPALQHYFDLIGEFADNVGVATPILDSVIPLYERFMAMGFGERRRRQNGRRHRRHAARETLTLPTRAALARALLVGEGRVGVGRVFACVDALTLTSRPPPQPLPTRGRG